MSKNRFRSLSIVLLTIVFTTILAYQLAQQDVAEIPYMYLDF